MGKIMLIILLSLCAQALAAEQKPEGSITASSELTLQVTSRPEMKLKFTERFVFPFLQGESSLTKDNNVSLALTAELSPISLNGLVEAVWTPVAFFQFSTGGRIGSGWIIDLFGKKKYGIGINSSNNDGKAEVSGSAFGGLLWKVQAGAALQADLAAIFPGDWHHIVARSYHEINYKGYSGAKKNESWYFEGTEGEDCNGFTYYGNFLIAYQMPIFLNMVGLLTEMDLYLYDTPGRKKWGDDIMRWIFSSVLNFSVTKQFDIMLLAQFRTRRNFQQSNWNDLYYRNRTLNNSNPIHLEFFRVAAVLTYKF